MATKRGPPDREDGGGASKRRKVDSYQEVLKMICSRPARLVNLLAADDLAEAARDKLVECAPSDLFDTAFLLSVCARNGARVGAVYDRTPPALRMPGREILVTAAHNNPSGLLELCGRLPVEVLESGGAEALRILADEYNFLEDARQYRDVAIALCEVLPMDIFLEGEGTWECFVPCEAGDALRAIMECSIPDAAMVLVRRLPDECFAVPIHQGKWAFPNYMIEFGFQIFQVAMAVLERTPDSVFRQQMRGGVNLHRYPLNTLTDRLYFQQSTCYGAATEECTSFLRRIVDASPDEAFGRVQGTPLAGITRSQRLELILRVARRTPEERIDTELLRRVCVTNKHLSEEDREYILSGAYRNATVKAA